MGMMLYAPSNGANPPQEKVSDPQFANSLAKSFPFKKLEKPVDACISLLATISEKTKKELAGLSMIFRASEHKFKSSQFHQLCCEKVNTIVIALTTQGQVFGGFTPCAWTNGEYPTYSKDDDCLTFLFNVEETGEIATYPLKEQNKDYAIMNDQQLGPVFGEGHDLLISNESDRKESWNNLGKSYECEYQYGSIKANSRLTGEQQFKLKQYEVWQLIFAN